MYSFDFRRKVLEIREAEALSMAAVAARFGVGALSVMRWTKNSQPCLRRNKPGAKIDRHALCEDVRRHSDHFLHERAHRFGVTASGIRHALKRLEITYIADPL